MASSDTILSNLRALADARRSRGDRSLILRPSPDAQEYAEFPDIRAASVEQGLVLEPYEGAPFEVRDLARRRQSTQITAFCDGIRSTYFVGFEDNYPLLFTRNAAAVRARDIVTGYHRRLHNIQLNLSTLLAPLRLFQPTIRGAYQELGLLPVPLADLCRTETEDDGYGLTPIEMQRMNSVAWQGRGQRRARRLLDLSEQVVALAGARLLREEDSTGLSWMLKDGSLFQFDKRHLTRPELMRGIISCVKSHPIPFFGPEGERKIAQLEIGQRTLAFLPRPLQEAERGLTWKDTARRMVSWYLRVSPPAPRNSNRLSGVIRLDMPAIIDWSRWIDDVSWAVLDEFYGLSAMPDSRYDVMPYGIYDCEQFLKAQQIPGELLLAPLD